MPTNYCNMNCKYCFHHAFHSNENDMELETLEKLMEITLKSYEIVTFIWHGGEPLAMGMDFYKHVVKMQKKYNKNDVKINNRMQTNLTLINKEIAEFLVSNHFGIGSSFDGVNNELTRGCSKRILNGRKLLLDAGGNCGFITVVSNFNVDRLIETYEFFKRENANFTINPYLSVNGSASYEHIKLDGRRYTQKVLEFYDYWLYDKICNIKVGYFHRFLEYFLFFKKTICTYTSCLGKWVGILCNGDITPCNRYFPEEYIFGNVNDIDDISEAFESDGFGILLSKSIKRRDKCKECNIYNFCNGGCNNVALNASGIDNNGGVICESLKMIYTHIEKSIFNVIATPTGELENYINPLVLKLLKKKQGII